MHYNLPAMVIRPRVSRYQRRFLIGLHFIALAAFSFAPLGFSARSLLFALLLLHAAYTYQRYLRASGDRVAEVKIEADGTALITLESGLKKPCRLSHETLLTPWLIILRFNLLRQRRSEILVIWMDTLPEDEIRQLRVLLRFSRVDQ